LSISDCKGERFIFILLQEKGVLVFVSQLIEHPVIGTAALPCDYSQSSDDQEGALAMSLF